MYNGEIAMSQSEYGQPPENCREECEALCKGKTVKELQQISDYFSKESRDLDNFVDSTVTKDDFEQAKKDHGIDEPNMKIDDQDKEPQDDNDGEKYNE